MGTSFNFAKEFIGRIDCVGSALVDVLSVKLAFVVTKYLRTDLGLNYTIFFGVLILLVGTLQWFAWDGLRGGSRTNTARNTLRSYVSDSPSEFHLRFSYGRFLDNRIYAGHMPD